MAGEAVPIAMPVADGEDDAEPPRQAAGAPPAALAIAADAPTRIAPPAGLAPAGPSVAGGAVPLGAVPASAMAGGPSAPLVATRPGPAAAFPSAPAPLAAAPMAAAPAPRVPAPMVKPAAAPVDPLAEAPAAVWYVRPPAGGQFGPAGVQVMREWLGQRRVGPDYLVWREGWPDWRPAAFVFPQLGGGQAAGMQQAAAEGRPQAGLVAGAGIAGTAGPFNDDWVDAIIDSRPSISPRRRHAQPQSNLSLVITLVIILLALVLAIVLIRLAIIQSRESAPSSQWQPVRPAAFATRWV